MRNASFLNTIQEKKCKEIEAGKIQIRFYEFIVVFLNRRNSWDLRLFQKDHRRKIASLRRRPDKRLGEDQTTAKTGPQEGNEVEGGYHQKKS